MRDEHKNRLDALDKRYDEAVKQLDIREPMSSILSSIADDLAETSKKYLEALKAFMGLSIILGKVSGKLDAGRELCEVVLGTTTMSSEIYVENMRKQLYDNSSPLYETENGATQLITAMAHMTMSDDPEERHIGPDYMRKMVDELITDPELKARCHRMMYVTDRVAHVVGQIDSDVPCPKEIMVAVVESLSEPGEREELDDEYVFDRVKAVSLKFVDTIEQDGAMPKEQADSLRKRAKHVTADRCMTRKSDKPLTEDSELPWED